MLVEYFVVFGDSDPIGPVPDDLIVRGIEAGKIPPGAYVAEVGHPEWAPLVSVRAFAAAIRRAAPPVPARSPMKSGDAWYAQRPEDPQAFGPFAEEDLARGLRSGQIAPDVLVCRVGEKNWVTATSVPGFRAATDDARERTGAFRIADIRRLTSPSTRRVYVAIDGPALGPYTDESLVEACRSGAVPDHARVCIEGEAAWLPITEVSPFARAFQSQLARSAAHFTPQSDLAVAESRMAAAPTDGPRQALSSAMHQTDALRRPTASSPHDGEGEKENAETRTIAVDALVAPPEAQEDREDVPLRALQDQAGTQAIDLRGADGRDGADGRPGRDGRSGQRLKNGGYTAGGNGTGGSAGQDATNGRDGRHANLSLRMSGGTVVLSGAGMTEEVTGNLTIDAVGGAGGAGGDGGRGGSGGSGSPSGHRGADGRGGDGGDGGDGGVVTVTTGDAHLLAVVYAVRVFGGRGGRGGSGDPPGRSGSDGSDGAFSFSVRNERTGDVEEGDTFGLSVGEVTIEDDGSRINGHFTRESTFTVSRVPIANEGDFSILAPFFVLMRAESPVDLEEDSVVPNVEDVAARDAIEIRCAVRGRIRSGCDIGHYTLRIAAFSSRGDLTLCLNHEREDAAFRISVNHRLAERDIHISDPAERARIAPMAVRWNGEAPEAQTAFFAAAVVTAASFGAPIPHARQAELSRMLEGRLLDPGEMWQQVASPDTRGEAALGAALHFFFPMPLDSKSKLLDAAYFIACGDGLLEVHEKAFLRDFSQRLGFDDGWLATHMPKVLTKGTSQARATATNWPATFMFPVTAVGVFVAGTILASQSTWATSASERYGIWFTLLGVLTCTLVCLQPFRKLCFRTACRACGSVRLAHIERHARDGSLVGDADALRCVDCGARGNQTGGHAAELIASDCPIASRSRLPLAVVVIPLLAVGLAVGLRYVVNAPFPDHAPLLLIAGASFMAGLVAKRARRVDGSAIAWSSALCVALGLGFSWYADGHPNERPIPSAAAAASKVEPAQASAPPPATAASASIGNTGGEGVFLRRTPNPADRLRALPDGARVDLTGRSRRTDDIEWLEVRVSEGMAWVPAKYVIRLAHATRLSDARYEVRMHIAVTRATVGCPVIGSRDEIDLDPRLR